MSLRPHSALENLLPTPRECVITGPEFVPDLSRIAEASDPQLPPQGYRLRLTDAPGGPQVVVSSSDEDGGRYARATLEALTASGGPVPQLDIRDWPAMRIRGTIEGFYGPPWSHADRIAHVAFSAQCKLNRYWYAPKNDPYHRARWRDPYPPAELALLRELAGASEAAGVRFVYCIAPGLTMEYSSDEDNLALHRKAGQLWDAGIRHFSLLFDDVPPELSHESDLARFGRGAGSSGTAHGVVATRFVEEFLAPRGVTEPLEVTPTDYAGVAPSVYRDQLAATLPADAMIFWTGSDIVVGEITRDEADAAAASYQRPLLLWDNYPVNDYDFSRAFLGPLQGRDPHLAESAIAGIAANPMNEATASRFALVSMADWAWNPAAYRQEDAARRAMALVAGDLAELCEPLVAVLSSWPPSAVQDAELQSLAGRVLSGEPLAREAFSARLTRLAESSRQLAVTEGTLARELAPWASAAAESSRAGLLALELLQATAANRASLTAQVAEALAAAEATEKNVLRDVLIPFVRTVLGR